MEAGSPSSTDSVNANQPSSVHASSTTTTQSAAGGQRFSNNAHIRSRITVVCAECKRLKLKCDRRTPCGSCVKRDTVHRCQYSAAAAEKIDVQSLHNRLQIIETQMAQIIAGGMRAPAPAPGAAPDTLPFPHNDRSMLATGASGSSVTMSLQEVAALWMELLDMPQALPVPDPASSTAPLSSSSSSQVKLQPTAADLSVHDEAPFHTVLPPLKVYYPHGTSTPSVTPQLIALLPSQAALRSRITQAVEDTMKMHPCFNFKHFKARTESMFAWVKEEDSRSASAPNGSTNAKAELARSIFFNANPPPAPVQPKSTPTLSFFAAVAAAYALGVSVSKENEYVSDADIVASYKDVRLDDSQRAVPTPGKSAVWVKCSASALYALSQQALSYFEMSNMYDLDYLVACILQILYLLHDGKPRIAHVVYPLVGKMVNIAQMMGLATDPDEFPGRYTLFEAEQRRRIWWDIYYYDVFIADCMGHMPIIQDNTYTTKIPADVDEEQFTPASSTLPVPVPRGAGGDPSEVGFAFFALKCRLAQLVKSVKKRSFTDPLSQDALEHSLEQAEQFEQEVKTWLSEIPRPFRLDADIDGTNSARIPISATLQAQRCELAIVANRIILKLFLPFLKTCSEEGSDMMTPRRVVSSVVDAAHAVIHSVRLTHSVWRQTRPAAFAFYSFGRTLFDAVVMSASAVIVHPTGASSGVAVGDLNTGLDLMKDTRTAFARSCKESCSGGTVDEAVRIVEMLKSKAEAIRAGEMLGPVPAYAGTKRKRSDEDDFNFEGDFQLPYVGAGVTCARADGAPEPSPVAEVSRPSTAMGSKRSKQDGTMAPDLPNGNAIDSVSPPSQDLPPQIPTRGRPRGSSSARHRVPPGSMNGKLQLQVQSQPQPQPVAATRSEASTPAPDPATFNSLPDLLLSELPNQQSQMKYAPFGSEGPSSAGIYEQPPPAMSQPQMTAHYPPPMSTMPPPQQGQHNGSLYSSIAGPPSAHSTPPYAPGPPSHHSSPYTQDYYPMQGYGQLPSTPYEVTVGLPPDAHARHSTVAPGQPSAPPQEDHSYMMGGPKSHSGWPQSMGPQPSEPWAEFPKYY